MENLTCHTMCIWYKLMKSLSAAGSCMGLDSIRVFWHELTYSTFFFFFRLLLTLLLLGRISKAKKLRESVKQLLPAIIRPKKNKSKRKKRE